MAGQGLGAVAEALAKAAAGAKEASECYVPPSNIAVPQCEEVAIRPQVTERSLCRDGVAAFVTCCVVESSLRPGHTGCEQTTPCYDAIHGTVI